MRGPFAQQRRNDEQETEKAPFLVVQKIRDAILDETFKPGERLPEEQVGKMFNVSRSPVREALLALEKEGTVVMEPFKGATVKPLSPRGSIGHRRTQVIPHNVGGQTGLPPSVTNRL
jgi:DNA-binding GntR family transcriptional regulator